MGIEREITAEDLYAMAPSAEAVEEALRLIRGLKRGRLLELARLLTKARGKDDVGRARLCLLAQMILSEWRGERTPTGVRGQMLRLVANQWVEADRESPRGTSAGDHIGYEYLIDDVMMQRDWKVVFQLANQAETEGWRGPWSEAAEHAKRMGQF
jgi:hypothetical protein